MAQALMKREFLLKQLVACALIDNRSVEQDSSGSEDDGEEWEVGSQEGFRSPGQQHQRMKSDGNS